jgi:hypothetical protein
LKGLKVCGRSNLDLMTVRQLYVAECKRRGCNPIAGDAFTDDVHACCKARGVVLEDMDGRVVLVGVRLSA